MAWTRVATGLAAAAVLACPIGATAAPTITEFTTGLTQNSGPRGITAGPDGNLWFAERADPGGIGRITPAGTINEFGSGSGLSSNSGPTGITASPDGNLWFTEVAGNRIGRITPAASIDEFDLAAGSAPNGITAGPDGNLWFTQAGSPDAIGRITPSGTVDTFTAGLTPNSNPQGITAGPDGNLWFTEFFGSRVGRITPAGTITEFSEGITGANLLDITTGPDGNLWFTSFNRIGRITPNGAVTEFPAGPTSIIRPVGITTGPDGNLWFTETTPSRIGRVTPEGVITEYTAGLSTTVNPHDITAGPDGNVWFTAFTASSARIGRITPGPGVETGLASGISASAATLNGSVRPNSQLTTFQFQYGTDTGYGSETPSQVAGQDAASHPVSAALTGLEPSTTYHYRLVATNPSDTTFGADFMFTTDSPSGEPGPAPGPGPEPGPGPGPGGTPQPPAKADLSDSPSSVRVNRKRRFRFPFEATAGLTGKAVFKSIRKVKVSARRRIVLARKSFTVPANGKVRLKLRLKKKNFRILKRERKIPTRVTVTLTNAAGLTSTATKRVRLKAPRRR